jgi:beta-lactam-binding protein with PASTA domain
MDARAFGLGIDFGTSNTVAMLRWPDGRVKPVLFEGSPLLPSAVFAPADGPLVVGSDALHNGRFEPSQLEPNPKRHIDDEGLLLGSRELAVLDLFTAVLRHVTAETTRVTGGVVPHTAVAYPAVWGPVRRSALADAARAAGLGEVTLVPEPTAAAHYFTSVLGRDVPIGQALVVYDLGAGTFDASAVVRRDGGFEVVAVDGLHDVGGLDLDAALVKWLQEGYGAQRPDVWARLTNPTGPDEQRDRRLLWDDVRVAKEMLSRAPAVQMRLPALDLDIRITRDEFEAVAEPLLARTVRTTGALIRYAELGPNVAGLLLVGGSSRVPMVATLLHRALRIAPIATEQPELIVAEGALLSVPQAPQPQPQPAPVSGAALVGAVPVSAAPVSAVPVSAAPTSGAAVGMAPVSPAPAGAAPFAVAAPSGVGFAPAPAGRTTSWATAPTAPHSALRAADASITGTVYARGHVPPMPDTGPPVDLVERGDSRVIPLWDVPLDDGPRGGHHPAPHPAPRPGPAGDRGRRTTPLQLVVGVIVGLLIVAAGAFGVFTLQNGAPRVAVPDVAGASRADATTRLRTSGLKIGEVTYEDSSTVAADLIIRTDPPGDRRVRKGTTVKLVLARAVDAAAKVAVPDVTNKTRDDAVAGLQAAGLTVGEVLLEDSTTVPAGTVIRTEPPANSQATKDTPVKLIVANRPGSESTAGPSSCDVPDVTHKTRDEAVSALQHAKLRYEIKKEESAHVRPGTVIRTDPPAGHYNSACRTVTVVVSQGVAITVPNVVGMSESEARSTLEADNLVAAVSFRNYCAPARGGDAVEAQNPRAGATAHEGDTVTITVPRYTGACPSPAPGGVTT